MSHSSIALIGTVRARKTTLANQLAKDLRLRRSRFRTTLHPAHYATVARMNLQHAGMATSALLFVVSKFTWDTWQFPRRDGQYLWLVFLGVLGVILNLYVE